MLFHPNWKTEEIHQVRQDWWEIQGWLFTTQLSSVPGSIIHLQQGETC